MGSNYPPSSGRERTALQVKRLRPQVTTGSTFEIKTGCGSIFVTINEDDKGPCEVFVRGGKHAGCISCQMEGFGRLLSLAMRLGGSLDDCIKQVSGLQCSTPTWYDGQQILSCADAVSLALKRYLQEKNDGQS